MIDVIERYARRGPSYLTALGVSAVLSLGVTQTGPVLAQDSFGDVLEEITVTARKREENLKDVPVAISVLNSDMITAAGIRDQFDLFDFVPGLNYGEERDRNGARPGVRGVQAQSQSSLRQKVSVFIDGMPVLGNIGSMQFAGVERIEVLRGPQSTAFGRATFGGAINYVTKDPGDEVNTEFYVATSDHARNQISFGIDGPITDTLGYTFNVYKDEYEGPDEWVSTDGVRLGSTATDYITGKLVWAPTNNFDMEVMLYHMETDDGPPIEAWLSQEARDACTNITVPGTAGGFGPVPYIDGDFNCDVGSVTPPGGIPLNHRPELQVDPTTDELLSVLARATATLEPGAYVDRDRIQMQFNFSTDDGSALQVLTSYQEEESNRWFDQDRSDTAPLLVVMMGSPAINNNVMSRSGPRLNEEKYVDVRWLSPGDRPVRWVVGASWFDYETSTKQWNQYAGQVLGLEEELNTARVNAGFAPVTSNPWGFRSRDNDFTTNIGYYAGITWDVTDRTTLSFEARQQEDAITQLNNNDAGTVTDVFENVTDSFQPRLAVTHALSDDVTLYAQYASGTNPAGVNLRFVDPEIIESIQAANAAGFIQYDETTFLAFEEEEVESFEVGLKGGLLNNRVQFAAALYVMDWTEMQIGTSFDWDGPWNTQGFDTGTGMVFINSGEGDLSGVELEGTYQINDNWNLRGAFVVSKNEYAQLCESANSVDLFGFTPTTITPEGIGCVDVDGNQIRFVPDNTATVAATYRAQLGGGGWEWAGRLAFRWQDRVPMDEMNLMWLPASTEFSGSLAFTNDNWDVTLFGNNLTDEDTPRTFLQLNNADHNLGGQPNLRLRPRMPRELGVRLTYRF